jgi:hypothetical protein
MAQNGLEDVIVEKYYISDANDTSGKVRSGFLPVGSTTYRIFLDLLPGYRFYAAYGKAGHELKIETTTSFFNNEDIGNKIPNVIPRHTLGRNTVMLDSWLSAGSAGENYYGVLKDDDDTIETVVHEKTFLQNKNKEAGIPVQKRDGLLNCPHTPFTIVFGIDSASVVFFNQNVGSKFKTVNGAWGCLGGAVGADSLNSNRILIAQVTTNGDLSFELNLQIGKRNSPPQYFVARNPIGDEIMLKALSFNSKRGKFYRSKQNKSKK